MSWGVGGGGVGSVRDGWGWFGGVGGWFGVVGAGRAGVGRLCVFLCVACFCVFFVSGGWACGLGEPLVCETCFWRR